MTTIRSVLLSEIERPLEITKTRFFVDDEIYYKLKNSPKREFILTIKPKKGKHPEGHYSIPNNIIVCFIESKIDSYNWEKNKNFHQDGVPKDLKNYFVESLVKFT